ncbi:MAG TPA: tripartite tricarboxylate transporter substrate binding protein [Gammaproteobacteria bacterium]|nr:tripartite tricarboxylate transporter substrate binding protein [Gammaproteobacteria bacterium]
MRDLKRKLSRLMVGLAGVVLATASTAAEFPSGPIEFVIPFGAGGGADIEGRLLAKEMSNVLGVSVTPVNKPVAGGAITYTYIVNAKPDGYTVAWNSTSVLTTTNLGNTDFDYDAMDHIGRVEFQPQPFVVKADAPWQTFNEFIADCKENPNTYKVANSGTGSATHVAAIALMNASGCQAIHLPKGIKGRNASVLSGEADAMVAPLTGAIKLTKAGKLRILVVPTAERNAVIPDVPTARELGYDAELDLFRGLSVPPGTPATVKEVLANAMRQAAQSDAFMTLAKQKGFTVSPSGPAEFSSYLSQEDAKVKSILKAAGLYRSN